MYLLAAIVVVCLFFVCFSIMGSLTIRDETEKESLHASGLVVGQLWFQ